MITRAKICLQWSIKPEPRLDWSPLKLRTRIYKGASRPPVVAVKNVPARHHLPRTFIDILYYQGVHMQNREHTESTGKISIGSFYS